MTCLSIVQNVARRILPNTAVSAVVASTDPQIVQLLALLNEEGQTLAEETDWQALTAEATFTTAATETQGALSTIAPGCKFIINDTIWNRTLRMPVFGPDSPQLWQQQQAMYYAGPWNQYRVRGGNIIFVPVPTAAQSCYFEYVSKNWVTLAAGGTASAFAADGDTALLDEQLLEMGLIWRWKQVKGLDFDADYKKYERRVYNAKARDASRATLNLAGNQNDFPAIVIVPAGNWG